MTTTPIIFMIVLSASANIATAIFGTSVTKRDDVPPIRWALGIIGIVAFITLFVV